MKYIVFKTSNYNYFFFAFLIKKLSSLALSTFSELYIICISNVAQRKNYTVISVDVFIHPGKLFLYVLSLVIVRVFSYNFYLSLSFFKFHFFLDIFSTCKDETIIQKYDVILDINYFFAISEICFCGTITLKYISCDCHFI